MNTADSLSQLMPERSAFAPPPETVPLTGRFTVDGDRALEVHLAKTCERVLSGVRGLVPEGDLEALLLGGGYGRGEGGVLSDDVGDWPYNDIEFYVCISGNRLLNEARYHRPLEVLGQILTQLADVEVEFKITSIEELSSLPVSMFSYDLLSGHRLLWGEPALLAGCAYHRQAEQIPLSEATRLLMNRGTGLLLARTKLAAPELTPANADFIKRNIAKAALACGDAILTARGLYHWSCRERARQLERIALCEPSTWHDALLKHHAAGVEFKLHPEKCAVSREDLLAEHAEVTALMEKCWLWVENRRLSESFSSARDYAQGKLDKCPGSPGLRSCLLNFRADRFRLHLSPRPWRHPRQRIFNAFALLLWEPGAAGDSRLLARLQCDLHTRATTPAGLMAAYEDLWRRVQ